MLIKLSFFVTVLKKLSKIFYKLKSGFKLAKLYKSRFCSVINIITILIIFGLRVFCKKFIKERKTNNLNRKNMRIPGHKITLYSLTSNRSITYLQCQYKPYTLSQRSFMRMFNAAVKQSATQSVDHSLLFSKRSYAAAHGGTLRNVAKQTIQTKKPTASSDSAEPIKSDTSGKHKIGLLSVCNKQGCKNTNCAEGTVETNPCKVSGEMHQKSIAETILPESIVHELNGAITHTIPKNSEGTFLYSKDINGEEKAQYIMKEKGVVPINPTDFKEAKNVTLYLQDPLITKRMADNASVDSVLNLHDKGISIHTSQVNTPLDDGF